MKGDESPKLSQTKRQMEGGLITKEFLARFGFIIHKRNLKESLGHL
jgi:hypothetical protein